MTAFWIVLGVLVFAVLLWLAVSYGFFCFAIRKPKKNINFLEHPTPQQQSSEWSAYFERMRAGVREIRALPSQELNVKSYDGLQLYARWYWAHPGEAQPSGHKRVLLFHGYHAFAENDFSITLPLLHSWGYDILLVDERAHGKSDGKYIGFGVLERFDVLSWCQKVNELYGDGDPMVVEGLSMGAATVLMSAGLALPANVRGIVADCGFTSPRDILSSVLKKNYHLPEKLMVGGVDLFSRRLAGYALREYSTLDAMARCPVPVLFIHGEADDFVPHEMSERSYAACTARKTFFSVPGAGHALSCLVDTAGYTAALRGFLDSLS